MRSFPAIFVPILALAACKPGAAALDETGAESTSGTDSSHTTEGSTGDPAGPDGDSDSTAGAVDGTTEESTGADTETGGPDQPVAFCAVVRGPLMPGDGPTPVYHLDDALTPTPVLEASGELFPSPSGRQLAHVLDGAVWVYDLDDASHTQVSQDATVEDLPLVVSWAPTGEALMYQATNPRGGSNELIYVVRLDGSDHTELTTRGISSRSVFSHGNVAATLERAEAGGPTVKVKLVDMDAATPTAVQADAYPGVDECAPNRPLQPCGEGVLAEVGDCTESEIFHVHADGSATAVTSDGMGGLPVGCAPATGHAVFSRGQELLGGMLDGSATKMPISGAEGYAGLGAEVVEVPGVDGGEPQSFVYYESMSQTPHSADLLQIGVAASQLLEESVDLEVPPQVGFVIALFTFAAEQTSGYLGGIGTGLLTKVFEAAPGERIIEAVVETPPMEAQPEADDSWLVMITDSGAGLFDLRAFRGDGDQAADDGLVLSEDLFGDDPFGPVACRGRDLGFVVCLTESQIGGFVGVMLLRLEQWAQGEPGAIEHQSLGGSLQDGYFSVFTCDPL